MMDCNKEDLCMSFEDMKAKNYRKYKSSCCCAYRRVILHFRLKKSPNFCKEKNLYLVEDCAHIHGAWWRENRWTLWIYWVIFLLCNKDNATWRWGMVASKDKDFLKWVEKISGIMEKK